MTTTPQEPLGDGDMETVGGDESAPLAAPGTDADGTDADAADGTDADATDGDSSDTTDGDATDG